MVSTEFASGYVEQSSRLAEAGGDSRAELLGILLDGYDESDQRVSSILHTNGFLAGHQAFCVGCVEPRDKTEMFNPARANRLLDAIAEGIAIRRRILGIRDNKVVFVASDVRRLSGYSRASEPLFHRVADMLTTIGPQIRIGISDDVFATSHIRNACEQAMLALSLADDTHRVVQFPDIQPREYLLHLARQELKSITPAWASRLFQADDKLKGKLIATMRAYAKCNLNVLKAAEMLHCHPNTIYSRFEKVREITGLNPREFFPLEDLLVVADMVQRG